MMMPGRKYSAASGYRYGFNGQEKSTEIFNGSTTALFWEYDSRIGRRWNLDPKFNASESRYLVNGGNPIIYTDPLGDFKTKFGAKVHRFFNGGGKVGKNKYNEWYVGKNRGVEEKDGQVLVKSEYYYGKGRNKYSTAKEFLLSEAAIDMDIQMNGEKSKYQYYETSEEADKSALKLGTGLLVPNVFIKPLTIATASQKIINSPVGRSVGEFISLFKPINSFDVTKTLYRGTTGSETGSTVLFLTDDATVAATYVKNGGQVMSYEMSNYSLKSLELSGDLRMATGIHGKAGVVNKEYIFQGKNLVEAVNSLAQPLSK